MDIEIGDIIQITNENHKWYPCLLVVDEIKSWGVQAYISIPTSNGVSSAFIRVLNEDCEKVGMATITMVQKES